MRGLNRVLGRPVNAAWTDEEWLRELQRLHADIAPKIKNSMMPGMHAQDLQGCLCEWDKIERVRLGEGTPRSRYPGRA